MNKLIDIGFENEINASTARLFESKRLEITDYRNDSKFKKWYMQTTEATFSADDNINSAVDAYNQEQWCQTYCNPPKPPAQFRCRPSINGNFKNTLDDVDGYILKFADGKFQQFKCECLIAYENEVAEAKNTEIMAKANIPPLFKDKTFATYKPQNKSQNFALTACQQAAQSKKGVFLCGPVATGKTHLAISMLKLVLNRGGWGFYVRVVDFLQRLRPPNNDYVLLDRARECGFLVLDDLGMQKDTQWTFEKITDVIDYRNANLLPTAITSNLTLEAMSEGGLEYERIASRIEEGCELIQLQGDSYRHKFAVERARKNEK